MSWRKVGNVVKAGAPPLPKRMNEKERLKRLGLTPDVVDRNALAIAVLRGDELEKHERMFIARLLSRCSSKRSPDRLGGAVDRRRPRRR